MAKVSEVFGTKDRFRLFMESIHIATTLEVFEDSDEYMYAFENFLESFINDTWDEEVEDIVYDMTEIDQFYKKMEASE